MYIEFLGKTCMGILVPNLQLKKVTSRIPNFRVDVGRAVVQCMKFREWKWHNSLILYFQIHGQKEDLMLKPGSQHRFQPYLRRDLSNSQPKLQKIYIKSEMKAKKSSSSYPKIQKSEKRSKLQRTESEADRSWNKRSMWGRRTKRIVRLEWGGSGRSSGGERPPEVATAPLGSGDEHGINCRFKFHSPPASS